MDGKLTELLGVKLGFFREELLKACLTDYMIIPGSLNQVILNP